MYRPLGAVVEIDAGALAKPVADIVFQQLKPRMPELVDEAMKAAVVSAPKHAPALLRALTPALQSYVATTGPSLITAAAPSLESYITGRLYPKVIKPIAERELASAQQRAGVLAQRASLVTGGVVLAIGVGAALIWQRRKEIFA